MKPRFHNLKLVNGWGCCLNYPSNRCALATCFVQRLTLAVTWILQLERFSKNAPNQRTHLGLQDDASGLLSASMHWDQTKRHLIIYSSHLSTEAVQSQLLNS